MPARRKVIEAAPAQRIAPPPPLDEVGTDTGYVEVKARLPIHLHIALQHSAERNQRSMAAELRVAVQERVEREARR